MTYLLDANVFISANRFHYGMDFCPAFWQWLIEANNDRRVFSIEKVEDEIQRGDDALSEWAGERGPAFFLKPDEQFLSALPRVSGQVVALGYEPAGISAFLSGADYYLVAHALAHGHTVVSHEAPADSARRVKIPNVCISLGVRCMNPFEMLRRERARFVLAGEGRPGQARLSAG